MWEKLETLMCRVGGCASSYQLGSCYSTTLDPDLGQNGQSFVVQPVGFAKPKVQVLEGAQKFLMIRDPTFAIATPGST